MKYICKGFGGLILFLALGFLVAQPLLQSNYFIQVPIFEMTQNDGEDDTEEEDRVEDENTDEKSELLLILSTDLIMLSGVNTTPANEQGMILQIDRTIHIPPPECS
ncbi:hypothetical protein [Spongiimicrobium salis]|uniref:hypothetical protein n=1 Tax=Spongiimicrobium salis TaxID=1667022 RepID=UPI00374C9641